MEKKQLGISFSFSFLTHILIFGVLILLVYFVRKEVLEFENEGEKVAVWINLEPAGTGSPEKKTPPISSPTKSPTASVKKINKAANNEAVLVRQNIETKTSSEQNSSEETAKGKAGGSPGSSPTGQRSGQGSGTDSSSLLGLIRKKIEQAKHYPVLARARKVEGVSVLNFSINASGGVETLSLVKSSGSDILDQEALATVKRASPLPYYSLPIKISIKFSLE